MTFRAARGREPHQDPGLAPGMITPTHPTRLLRYATQTPLTAIFR
jgi:hypothetical protein